MKVIAFCYYCSNRPVSYGRLFCSRADSSVYFSSFFCDVLVTFMTFGTHILVSEAVKYIRFAFLNHKTLERIKFAI